MKRAVKPNVSSTRSVKGKRRGKINIPVDEIITAISHLGDKISELDQDGQWRSHNSLWSQLADALTDRLLIENTLGIRKYIYAAWRRKSSKLRSHFINHMSSNDMTTNREELPSMPSYFKISTRSKTRSSSNTSVEKNKPQEHLIQFSYEKWRQVSLLHSFEKSNAIYQDCNNHFYCLDILQR
jgi:hypothetical protein